MDFWSSTYDHRRSLDRSRGRSLDHRLLGRSISWSPERSVASSRRSAARSLGRSVARSLGRSFVRSVARSLDRSLDRSIARSLDCSVDRSIARSFHCSIARSVGRSVAPKNPPSDRCCATYLVAPRRGACSTGSSACYSHNIIVLRSYTSAMLPFNGPTLARYAPGVVVEETGFFCQDGFIVSSDEDDEDPNYDPDKDVYMPYPYPHLLSGYPKKTDRLFHRYLMMKRCTTVLAQPTSA